MFGDSSEESWEALSSPDPLTSDWHIHDATNDAEFGAAASSSDVDFTGKKGGRKRADKRWREDADESQDENPDETVKKASPSPSPRKRRAHAHPLLSEDRAKASAVNIFGRGLLATCLLAYPQNNKTRISIKFGSIEYPKITIDNVALHICSSEQTSRGRAVIYLNGLLTELLPKNIRTAMAADIKKGIKRKKDRAAAVVKFLSCMRGDKKRDNSNRPGTVEHLIKQLSDRIDKDIENGKGLSDFFAPATVNADNVLGDLFSVYLERRSEHKIKVHLKFGALTYPGIPIANNTLNSYCTRPEAMTQTADYMKMILSETLPKNIIDLIVADINRGGARTEDRDPGLVDFFMPIYGASNIKKRSETPGNMYHLAMQISERIDAYMLKGESVLPAFSAFPPPSAEAGTEDTAFPATIISPLQALMDAMPKTASTLVATGMTPGGYSTALTLHDRWIFSAKSLSLKPFPTQALSADV